MVQGVTNVATLDLEREFGSMLKENETLTDDFKKVGVKEIIIKVCGS